MSSATLTLLGLYQHGLRKNKNFFDKLTFPEGIDHDIAVSNILHQAGDFEVLYPDLDFMENGCEMFSKKWERTFIKWLEVMNIEYAPLENYNRLEAWSDSTSTSESHSSSESSSNSSSHSMSASESASHSMSQSASESASVSSSESTSTSGHTSTSDSTSNSAVTDNDISAFNANTLQPDTSAATNAITAGRSSNDTQGIENTVSGERSNNVSGQIEADQDSKNHFEHGTDNHHDVHVTKDNGVFKSINEHRGRVHGNIGVMTTQAMFLEEWELDKLNIYDEIYILFAREFTIPFSY